jgi:hypothetical protein
MMFRVCIARGDSANIGHPAPSAAKSTIVPNGYPARRWFMVDMTCFIFSLVTFLREIFDVFGNGRKEPVCGGILVRSL